MWVLTLYARLSAAGGRWLMLCNTQLGVLRARPQMRFEVAVVETQIRKVGVHATVRCLATLTFMIVKFDDSACGLGSSYVGNWLHLVDRC